MGPIGYLRVIAFALVVLVPFQGVFAAGAHAAPTPGPTPCVKDGSIDSFLCKNEEMERHVNDKSSFQKMTDQAGWVLLGAALISIFVRPGGSGAQAGAPISSNSRDLRQGSGLSIRF
jgi:hypothetical protein